MKLIPTEEEWNGIQKIYLHDYDDNPEI